MILIHKGVLIMKFMLEIKRNILTGMEEIKLFSKDEIKNYNFDLFKEIDNSSVKTFLKELDFIRIGKTKLKVEDNLEILISGIEIDEETELSQAIDKLNKFESKIA